MRRRPAALRPPDTLPSASHSSSFNHELYKSTYAAMAREASLMRYATFVAFFLQLNCAFHQRARNLLPQLAEPSRITCVAR